MIPAEFLDLIENNFQEEERQVLAACLLQDKRVLNTLVQLEQREGKEVDRFKQLENWRPAYFAFVLKEPANWKYDLSEIVSRLKPETVPVPPQLPSAFFNGEEEFDLIQAAEIALGFFSILKSKKWSELEEEWLIDLHFNLNAGLVAACLLGLYNPHEFILENILTSTSLEIKKTFFYGLFCNPVPTSIQGTDCSEVLNLLGKEARTQFLQFLADAGKLSLADSFLKTQAQFTEKSPAKKASGTLQEELDELQELNYLANLQLFSGKEEESAAQLDSFLQKVENIKQKALEKQQNILAIKEEQEKGLISPIPPSQIYEWKSIPAALHPVDLDPPDYQNIGSYLKEIEKKAQNHPKDSTFFLTLAELYHSLGDCQRSIHALKIARLLDPSDQDLNRRILDRYIEDHQWKAALQQYDESFKDKESTVDFTRFYLESKEILEKGDKTAVAQRLEGLPSGITSKDMESAKQIGNLYMELGEWEKAKDYFYRSISDETTDYTVWLDAFRCFHKLNQKTSADQILDQTADIFHERNGFYEQLVLALFDCGLEDQGLALIDKINVEHGNPEIIAAVVQHLMGKGSYECAYELALRAIKFYPLNPKLGLVTAQILMENDENEQANCYLDLATAEERKKPQFIVLESISSLKSKESTFPLGTQRLDLAELHFILQSLQKLPTDDYWKQLEEAEVQYLLDDTNQAIAGFKNLIFENSLGEKRRELWRAQVGLARAMLKIGQKETAITLLNEALLTQPKNVAIYELLADAYSNKNLSDEAVFTIQKARQICGKEKKFSAWFVDQMLKLGKPEEVRKYFNEEYASNQSSADFLVEKMKFEHQYGSTNEIQSIIHDLVLIDKATAKDLYAALKIAQEIRLPEESLKIIQKLQQTGQDDPESCILNASVFWNQGDKETALSYLNPLAKQGTWSRVCEGISLLADESDLQPQKVLDILQERPAIENQLQTLPASIYDILPEDWLNAFSSDDIWLKKITLASLENSNGPIDSDLLHVFSLYRANDVRLEGYRAIVSWLTEGDQSSQDWTGVLEDLNKISNKKQSKTFTGIILNILLDNGNEIAAAARINTMFADLLDEQNVLWAKARLLQRNNDCNEARILYEQGMKEFSDEGRENRDLDERILSKLKNLPIWKADCALEMGDWEKAGEGYFQGLNCPSYFSALKSKAMERLFKLALKEWSYKKIDVIRNLPHILERSEFRNLEESMQSLPSNSQKQYGVLHEFLLTGSIENYEDTSAGFLGAVSQVLSAYQSRNWASILSILEANSKEPDLPLLALSLFPKEHYQDLVGSFNDALFLNKKNPYLSAGLAKIFLAEQETDLAINALETAVEQLGDEASWRAQLAKLYEGKGDLQKAIVHSEQAVTLEPGNQESRKDYLDALYRNKNYSQIIAIFEKDRDQFTDEPQVLREVIDAYYQVGEFRKALSYMTMLKEAAKTDLELLLIQARIAEKLGSMPKAMELIREAYRIDPKSSEVIVELAKIKSLQESDEFGLEIIEKALESNIVDDQLVLEKVSYLEKIRGKKRAADFLEGYLEKSENLHCVLQNRYADLIYQLGNYEKSLQNYEKSAQLDDNQPLVHAMIGKLSMRKGNLDNAVFHLDKAIKQDAKVMDAYLDLSDALISRREEKRAEKVIKSALENCKEHYLIYEKASKVYNQLGDSEKAEAYLRKAAALNPSDENLREKLGIILANRIFDKK